MENLPLLYSSWLLTIALALQRVRRSLVLLPSGYCINKWIGWFYKVSRAYQYRVKAVFVFCVLRLQNPFSKWLIHSRVPFSGRQMPVLWVGGSPTLRHGYVVNLLETLQKPNHKKTLFLKQLMCLWLSSPQMPTFDDCEGALFCLSSPLSLPPFLSVLGLTKHEGQKYNLWKKNWKATFEHCRPITMHNTSLCQ